MMERVKKAMDSGYGYLLVIIPLTLFILCDFYVSECRFDQMEKESLNSYINHINVKKLKFDSINAQNIEYDGTQKCPYFIKERSHFCEMDMLSNKDKYILREYARFPYSNKTKLIKELHYNKLKDGTLFISVEN